MYIYFGELPSDGTLGTGGFDYIGYIICNHKSDKPYIRIPGGREYLSDSEKCELQKLLHKKKRERSFK